MATWMACGRDEFDVGMEPFEDPTKDAGASGLIEPVEVRGDLLHRTEFDVEAVIRHDEALLHRVD